MLGASDKITDTSASYYDERTEWWYGNSEGSLLDRKSTRLNSSHRL